MEIRRPSANAGGRPDILGAMTRFHTNDEAPTKLRRAAVPLGLLLFWTAVGLFFATAGGGIARGLTTWYLWGLLGWTMVMVDRRLPVPQERLGVRLLWHVPLSLVFSLLYLCLVTLVNAALFQAAPHTPDWTVLGRTLRNGGVQWNLLNYWLILGAYLAFNYHREAQERRHRAAHLETLLTEARLTALRAQLHPHFLFNALNTISAYVGNDPSRARAMLEHLGALLRFSLDSEGRREVSLAEEIAALDHYLAIQQARFAERLRARVDLPPQLRTARVPGLILQPLVENAITHGLSNLPGGGEVCVTAQRQDNDLVLMVADNGAGLPAGWSLDRDAGIGLANTRSRLAETYGAEHHFSISQGQGGGVVVEIRIPLILAGPESWGGSLE